MRPRRATRIRRTRRAHRTPERSRRALVPIFPARGYLSVADGGRAADDVVALPASVEHLNGARTRLCTACLAMLTPRRKRVVRNIARVDLRGGTASALAIAMQPEPVPIRRELPDFRRAIHGWNCTSIARLAASAAPAHVRPRRTMSGEPHATQICGGMRRRSSLEQRQDRASAQRAAGCKPPPHPRAAARAEEHQLRCLSKALSVPCPNHSPTARTAACRSEPAARPSPDPAERPARRRSERPGS